MFKPSLPIPNLPHTGFSKSVSNVNVVIHRVQDVYPHQSDISFPSHFLTSSAWFSTRHKLDWVWQFFVMCWQLCVKSEISSWSKWTIWQLLKNILDAVSNYVHILMWLGKPCNGLKNIQTLILKQMSNANLPIQNMQVVFQQMSTSWAVQKISSNWWIMPYIRNWLGMRCNKTF